MRSQSADEMTAIEAVVDDVVQQYHDIRHLVLQRQVDDVEVVLRVENIQVVYHLLVRDVPLTERRHLVEYRQRVAHTAISLLGNDVQCLLLVSDSFFLGHHLEMIHDIGNGHTLEVVYLAPADNRGQDLVLLGSGKDEDDMCRRLLQGLEEGIEGSRGKHVYLVDDEHLILTDLRRDACLLHQHLDVLHGVVRGSIQLEDVIRPLFVEGLAALAVVACFPLLGRRLTVDGLGEDACAGSLSHASRTAEKVGMSQLSALHRILQRGGQRLLSHHRIEGHRPVFAC